MRVCTSALMCAKHRVEYDLYFYASSPTIVALAANALICFASLLRLQSLAVSSIFVVYAVCANKSFVRSFLRHLFLIASKFLRCFAAKCLAAVAAAVTMMSEEGDEGRALHLALGQLTSARIRQRLRLTSKSVARFDASAAFEPKLLPCKSIFSHVLVFAYSLMLICAALAAERNPISSFHKTCSSMKNGL